MAWSWTTRLGVTTIAISIATGACADALRLEPPAGGAGGGKTTTTTTTSDVGGGGGGGSGPIGCLSNSDCPEPTSVCDTVKGICVECLELTDCAFRPGTVCDKGQCNCADDETWCGPNNCVDTMTSQQNCGECEHACFGACAAGACADPWEPTSNKNAPTQRSKHVAVWTGTAMIVWGGSTNNGTSGALDSGGMYDPVAREWTPTSVANAPSPRINATAVWTGTKMIVWGGRDDQGEFRNDGAVFDPATNSWTAMSTDNAPPARYLHTAVWSGTMMIVWGGADANNQLNSGGRYELSSGSWFSTAAIPFPAAPRERHTAVWDSVNKRMIVYGGFGDTSTQPDVYLPADDVLGGRRYDPDLNTWDVLTPTSGEPSARADHSAAWDGARMLVFGGRDASNFHDSGFKFEGGWSAFGGTPPARRYGHTAVWLDGPKRMIVWGGRGDAGVLNTGASYDPAGNIWGTIPTVLDGRAEHTAVSTGDAMIVWGGVNNGNQRLSTGGIYKP